MTDHIGDTITTSPAT